MESYSYHDLYAAARQALRKVDGENAEFTARQLVSAATDRTVSQLVADFNLTVFQRDIIRVNRMVERHLKGEPIAYILGQWEFYGLNLTVTPDVLIPRDDTEAVCDLAIHQTMLSGQNPRVLDLCAGSGSRWARFPPRPSELPRKMSRTTTSAGGSAAFSWMSGFPHRSFWGNTT